MAQRKVIQLNLRPIAGDRFQPTGFPDIGAATYERPLYEQPSAGGPVAGKDQEGVTWEKCLLVESAQSMANHLESRAWDATRQEPVAAFAGIPYVRVINEEGEYLTSSRKEAHRLASAYIKESKLVGTSMLDELRKRMGLTDNVPLDLNKIYRAVFRLDPMCLVHGVFFADKHWPGQPKITRALTSFVEAHGIRDVISGGVKRDDVQHKSEEGATAKEGYGFVPFHRSEYVAEKIEASFVLDIDQLDSYGLDEKETELLKVAALFEIRSLLDGGFRPRTACDLVPVDGQAVDIPALPSLMDQLCTLAGECADSFESKGAIEVVWDQSLAKKRGQRQEKDQSKDDGVGEDAGGMDEVDE